jgi:hypothetical protein
MKSLYKGTMENPPVVAVLDLTLLSRFKYGFVVFGRLNVFVVLVPFSQQFNPQQNSHLP